MSEFFLSALLLLGSGFILTAGIGIARLPDALCRAHALSKAATLGLSLLLLVLLFSSNVFATQVKLALALVFQFATIPIAGHIFALYAYKK